jgi:hypothetical protein
MFLEDPASADNCAVLRSLPSVQHQTELRVLDRRRDLDSQRDCFFAAAVREGTLAIHRLLLC